MSERSRVYVSDAMLHACYHQTISDFRKNNLKAIEKYFVDIVRIFSELGYTSVGKIYLDGTKLKGNASAKRTKDRAGFEKWLSGIEEEIAILLKEAETMDKQEDDTCKVDPEQRGITGEVIRPYVPEKEDRRGTGGNEGGRKREDQSYR
ncbi:MAG: Mobile element protein [Candidatus Jettenia ecosi]|uniref:Mobile element protein n=1 Tax=Candidatus Jettenia ecosi TaxID=2494326 RepID=A0A533QA67_9BACT|nr:MAG: Mobile element protein [Candidatus Jettenia ecosi]